MKQKKYKRIIAHTDFDGLISAFLLREIFNIDNILFTEPWIINSKEYNICKGDIIVDLPYDKRCSLWIDHHNSSSENAKELLMIEKNSSKIIFDDTKKSCPSLIYKKFHEKYDFLNKNNIKQLIIASDKIDSADFTLEELNNPDSYSKLSMSIKSDDKKKDDQYRIFLLNLLSFMPIEKIVEQPIVKQRIMKKKEEHNKWSKKIVDLTNVINDVVIIDLTNIKNDDSTTSVGNAPPFMIYTKFPKIKFSITIQNTKYEPELLKVSIGKNILLDKKPDINISKIMKEYGGGGHNDVGGCSIEKNNKDTFIKEILKKLT